MIDPINQRYVIIVAVIFVACQFPTSVAYPSSSGAVAVNPASRTDNAESDNAASQHRFDTGGAAERVKRSVDAEDTSLDQVRFDF